MSVITEYSDFAPRWRRLAAFLLDSFFLWLVWWLFLAADEGLLGWSVDAFYITVSNIVGVSPGKYYLRIFVQTRDGERPGVVRGLLRSVYVFVVALLFLTGSDAIVILMNLALWLSHSTLLIHRERRSVYDQIAGTWVVMGRRERKAAVLV